MDHGIQAPPGGLLPIKLARKPKKATCALYWELDDATTQALVVSTSALEGEAKGSRPKSVAGPVGREPSLQEETAQDSEVHTR
mgnify:CR=1 FL=1